MRDARGCFPSMTEHCSCAVGRAWQRDVGAWWAVASVAVPMSTSRSSLPSISSQDSRPLKRTEHSNEQCSHPSILTNVGPRILSLKVPFSSRVCVLYSMARRPRRTFFDFMPAKPRSLVDHVCLASAPLPAAQVTFRHAGPSAAVVSGVSGCRIRCEQQLCIHARS